MTFLQDDQKVGDYWNLVTDFFPHSHKEFRLAVKTLT